MDVFNNSVVQVQVGEMLYRFALECAEHKIRNTCDSICKECPSNIELYGLNKREAMLLQHTAELEMQHRFKLQHKLRIL
jgi:hypothetical protein